MSDINERLDRIERKLDALLAAVRGNGTGATRTARADAPASSAGGGPEVASDADLDGPRGDPEVRFVPKRWTGADHKGRRFSTCEPEFLDMLADAYEWFAQRDDESGAVDKNGSPKSRWSRLDASRARGWAARLRGEGGRSGAASSSGGGGARRGSSGSGRMNGSSGFGGSGGGGELVDEDIPF